MVLRLGDGSDETYCFDWLIESEDDKFLDSWFLFLVTIEGFDEVEHASERECPTSRVIGMSRKSGRQFVGLCKDRFSIKLVDSSSIPCLRLIALAPQAHSHHSPLTASHLSKSEASNSSDITSFQIFSLSKSGDMVADNYFSIRAPKISGRLDNLLEFPQDTSVHHPD
ncbi:uncharacterized protein MYCFIDRAFT_170105 [Pseudocercospora fijiensis CIRAD86]|uniref:Uncharacterized protein n=1 Tax=Pseudocercospora fijiensis (strain CIRAD86) TaxID=383855 RepID=N1Q9M0_PSEFD|nr:uncharacterized protein MYCFIDRAFT_170105 [Pseudocercospora fijiensis CIRAD86]EME88496.1 hypothetical protein MYCFIDRAFT_170105 [Pseudocercospora fijiensis CIRAD86]